MATARNSHSFDGFSRYIQKKYSTSNESKVLVQQVLDGKLQEPWEYRDSVLFHKQKVNLPKNSSPADRIIAAVHNGFHEGYQKTLYRITNDFDWPGMTRQPLDFVTSYLICQHNKVERLQPAGLLQALPIPDQIWSHISMDFIEELPSSHGKKVLLSC